MGYSSNAVGGADPGGSIIVGIAGGTGSGKSTLARRIGWALGPDTCAVVTQDNYYNDLRDMSFEARAKMNFDHPDAIDSKLLVAHVRQLRAGEPVDMPRYDFARHVRMSGGERVEPRPVILVEGILVFTWPELFELFDVRIFVDTADDVRLIRRMRRDVADRGRDVDSVLGQYQETVRPMHEAYVAPSRAKADLIVPGVGDNHVIAQLLARAFATGPL